VKELFVRGINNCCKRIKDFLFSGKTNISVNKDIDATSKVKKTQKNHHYFFAFWDKSINGKDNDQGLAFGSNHEEHPE
jgi:hypothetical protein